MAPWGFKGVHGGSNLGLRVSKGVQGVQEGPIGPYEGPEGVCEVYGVPG